jgi:hypothetical protein
MLVAMGAHAWGFLGGPAPISDWRGFLAPNTYQGVPVFGTVHLADLYHDPKLTLATLQDYQRIGRYLRGEWPTKLPESIIVSGLTLDVDRMMWWFNEASQAEYVAIDTEYNPHTKELLLVGLGIPGDYPTLQIRYNSCHVGAFRIWLEQYKKMVQQVPCVFHNALADVPVLRDAVVWRAEYAPNINQHRLGVDWGDYRQIDDTMQAHAVLWSELPHDLEFLASIYGKYPKLKHLAKVDNTLYNQGDVLETLSIWEGVRKELANDPLSRRVYDTQLRLLPIVEESMQRGIAVNTERVSSAFGEYQAKVDDAQNIAWAYTGWPINLGSDDQLGYWLYDVEGMAEQKARRKQKGKKVTKTRTVNEDAVAVLRGQYLDVDPDMEITTGDIDTRIARGAHPLLEARVLYSGAKHAMDNYLKPLMVQE